MKKLNFSEIREELLSQFDQSLKNLRIADVEILITAAHRNNLGKSAALHHLSQSATSTAVQRVEAAFGIPLCTHEKRRFRLTREGQLLLPRLEQWLRQLRELIVAKDQVPIRLATTHAIAQVVILPLLSDGQIEFKSMRPDKAYAAVLASEADLAIVLDNAPWKGVAATELGKGHFCLYSRNPQAPLKSVLLPEEQLEVVALQHKWQQVYGIPLPLKSRIPSWSLIASICAQTDEIGFLPDFLARQFNLHPVSWQPKPSSYRALAIYATAAQAEEKRFENLLKELANIFNH